MPRPILSVVSLVPANRQFALALVAVLAGMSSLAVAQDPDRPRALDLLPERTSVYVEINNVKQLVEDFKQSNFGRMLQDERIAPLMGELYGQAKAAWDNISPEVGDVSLQQILDLPTGEVCFAVVTPRRQSPSFALLVDVGEDSETATRLLDRMHTLVIDEGGRVEDQERQGMATRFIKGDDDDSVYYVLHQGTFLAANDEAVFDEMLTRWNGTAGDKDKTLTANRKFTTIMNKCGSIDDQPLALSFFVDPIMLARSATQGNATAGLVFGALRVLGIDGINGIGGSAIFNEQEYESIFHAHLLLSSPREGIFEMIALKPGMHEPEPFVPDNCASYMTSHWDTRKFWTELEKIVDTFTAEGTFQQQVQDNVNDELDIDIKTDLIDNMEGRITYLSWVNDSGAINAQSNALAVQMTDVEMGNELVEKVIGRISENTDDDRSFIVEDTYQGVSYWKTSTSMQDQRRIARARRQARRDGEDPNAVTLDTLDDDRGLEMELRPTQPCMGFIGDHFVITDSTSFFEHLIETFQGEHPRMADDRDYEQVMRDMRNLLGTEMPSMTMYAEPAQSFKILFNLAESDNTRDLLNAGAENNRYLADIQRAMEDHPLPPFEEIAHYFPPQGGFVVNDDTGFHFLAFQRRAEDP